MSTGGRKPIIGILGGVASGKSTVAAEFHRLGCALVDADKIAHELLEQEDIREQVVAQFGRGILDSNGKIDRRKLGKIAFGSPEKLRKLTGIVHPRVLARADELIEQFSQDPAVKAIALDMPLLVEVGYHKRCNSLIFVACDQKKRLERAQKMGLGGPNEVKIRENFQISLDNKAAITENIIDNNSDLSALVRQVEAIFPYIVADG